MDPRLSTHNCHSGDSATFPPPRSQNQPPTRKIAHWSKRENDFFVAACETVTEEGHRNGNCFTKHGWDRVIHLFNTTSGHLWTKQQLKNHWDGLRQKYKRLKELINCSGIEYISKTGTIVASDEWWDRKIKENKDYKEFRDKDCREVYSYKVLFGDAFDSDKYAVTPSQMCRTGFAMFEDSGYEDLRDSQPNGEENSASSDEGDKSGRAACSMDVSRPRSGEKRTCPRKNNKDKRKKTSAVGVSESVGHAASASQQVVDKIERLVGPPVPNAKTLMAELLGTGRLQKKTDLYFWTMQFLGKRVNREILATQDDANDKFDWVEWSWIEYRKDKL